jgi:hypothetical protein
MDPVRAGDGLTWLGADVATSIQVAEDHYVWLFGDTYLGSVETEDDCRNDESYCNRVAETHPPEVHNTIGVAKRQDGSWGASEKYWRVGERGRPEAIFRSGPEHFYWPMTGAMVGRKLLVAAARMSHGELLVAGTTFFLVSNPEDNPDTWVYTSHDADTSNGISWTTAVVKDAPWIYIFGEPEYALGAGSVVSRIAVNDAEAGNWGNREYLQRQAEGPSRWGKERDSLFDTKLPAVSETSIEWDPGRGRWYSIQIPPFTFSVELHTATSLEGEWTAAGEIFRLPSQWSEATICTDDGSADCQDGPAYLAYAAKLHPWLADGDEIVFTYNVNNSLESLTRGDEVLRSTIGFYVPQLVSVAWPETLR